MPGDITGSLVYDAAHGRVLVPRGPGLHQPAARRRDQPHPAEDPGRRCWRRWRSGRSRSTARRGRCPSPFLVARDPEPGRVRGHLPAARGAAGPVPAQGRAAAAAARGRARGAPAGTRAGFDPRDLRAAGLRPVAGPADLAAGAAAVRAVTVAPEVAGYIVDIARATRSVAVAVARRQPRAARPRCWRPARAWAWLNGRDFVTPDDVKALAHADARAPAVAAARGRARGRRRRLRAGQRPRLRARPPLSRAPAAAALARGARRGADRAGPAAAPARAGAGRHRPPGC